jgi:hypothetical protein
MQRSSENAHQKEPRDNGVEPPPGSLGSSPAAGTLALDGLGSQGPVALAEGRANPLLLRMCEAAARHVLAAGGQWRSSKLLSRWTAELLLALLLVDSCYLLGRTAPRPSLG